MKLRGDGNSNPAVDVDEILLPASTQAMPPSAGESVSSAVGLLSGRWVRQDGALVFEQPDSQPDRILILIAISGLTQQSNGGPPT